MLKVRCQAQATVDDKGRLALPAPLRHALQLAAEPRLVITLMEGALWGWTPTDFEEKVEAPILARDQFATGVRDFVHSVVAPAQDVEVDGQGRIRLPPLLREQAGIGRDVVIHSLLDRVEIWDKTAWEERFRQSLERRATASGMPKGD